MENFIFVLNIQKKKKLKLRQKEKLNNLTQIN